MLDRQLQRDVSSGKDPMRPFGRGNEGSVNIEILTYAPTAFYHCQHCEIAFGQMGVGERVHRDRVVRAQVQVGQDDGIVHRGRPPAGRSVGGAIRAAADLPQQKCYTGDVCVW